MFLVLLQMCFFIFFFVVCVVFQMVGILLIGDVGGLLKFFFMCEKFIFVDVCKCCDLIQVCQYSFGGIEFEGVDDCIFFIGFLIGLMYGFFVLIIFGSVLCFVAIILGCIVVVRGIGRNQVLFMQSFIYIGLLLFLMLYLGEIRLKKFCWEGFRVILNIFNFEGLVQF